MRKDGFLSAALAALLFLGVACGSRTPSSSALLTPPPLTAQIDATSYPTLEALVTGERQSVSGFVVSLERFWRDGKQVYAEVCFTLPDNSDWTVWEAHLEYGGQTLSEFSTSLLRKQEAEGGQAGQRCDELGFYVPPDADLSSASLTIASFAAPPGGADYCSIYMPKIQQALDERGLAIQLACVEANGAMSMQIVSKPEGMSDEEAQQIVFSEEFYTIKGPWTFAVHLP